MRKIEDVKNITKQNLIDDYAELKSLRKIAKKYDTDHGCIRNCFIRMGLEYREENCRFLSLNQSFFENIDDPNVLYWIGFLLADGCIFGEKIIKLALSEKDIVHLEKFKEDINYGGNISRSVNKLSEQNPKWNDVNTVILSISSAKMVLDVKKFGLIPQKTFKIKFPDFLINHKYLNVFFRGYIDGDGSWCFHESITRPNRKKQLCFSVRGTIDFLTSLNKILIDKNIIPKDRINKKINTNSSVGGLLYVGNNISTNIAKWIYSDIIAGEDNRCLDRKFEIVKEFLLLPDKKAIQ